VVQSGREWKKGTDCHPLTLRKLCIATLKKNIKTLDNAFTYAIMVA